jgi:TRAP transporter TAXI family solute receptor
MGFTRRDLLSGAAALAVAGAAASVRAQGRDPSWPRSLTLGTASVGGTYAVYGQAWASLVGDKIGVPISTQQTQGPNQNILLLQNKEIDLGMTTMGVALQAWNGEGDWTRGTKMRDIRALFPMYDTPFQIVTLKKSGITSVQQLAGKRVGVGPRAGTPGTYYPLMFQALGVPVTIRNGQGSDMASQLADGLIDAYAFAAGLPVASFSEIEATNPVNFFTFTADEIEKLRKAFPEFSPAVIPAGTYRTQSDSQQTVGLFNFAVAHRELPESLAFAVVKAVHENQDAMIRGHAAAKESVPENVIKNTFLPFHAGAARYYKERGLSIPASLIG